MTHHNQTKELTTWFLSPAEMFGEIGHYPVRGLCECFLNYACSSRDAGHYSAELDNIRLEVSILDG
jgi:hypothetical protein